LLPTAGAGGAALTMWAIAKTGIGTKRSGRTLLTFLVLLYGVFLAGIALSGAAVALGLGGSAGNAAVAGGAACRGHRDGDRARPRRAPRRGPEGAGRIASAPRCSAPRCATRSACCAAATPALLGAPAWWAFDAAVLWATFHALGEPPSLAVLAFAYFAGQVGNTIPLPGAVSGGMVGTLLAFGVAPDLALSAVLSYRAVAIWLPAPLGLAALGRPARPRRPVVARGRRGRRARRVDRVAGGRRPPPSRRPGRRGPREAGPAPAGCPAGAVRLPGFGETAIGHDGLNWVPDKPPDDVRGASARDRPERRRRAPNGAPFRVRPRCRCRWHGAGRVRGRRQRRRPRVRRGRSRHHRADRHRFAARGRRRRARPRARLAGAPESSGAGYGIEIIRRLAQHVALDDGKQGVALTMRFRRGGPGRGASSAARERSSAGAAGAGQIEQPLDHRVPAMQCREPSSAWVASSCISMSVRRAKVSTKASFSQGPRPRAASACPRGGSMRATGDRGDVELPFGSNNRIGAAGVTSSRKESWACGSL
jgi:hypothetical protein